ncbi:MAG: hypothetical protein JXR19_09060 [Bacteroidia bacterium]
MINKEDFRKYKNQSYFLKLKELASTDSVDPYKYRMIFFGGTGAVGGQAVIEVLHGFQYIERNRYAHSNQRPELVITGIDLKQIDQFCSKLYQVFGKENFKLISEEGETPTYIFENLVVLNFKILLASPKFKSDLDAALPSYNTAEEKIDYLKGEASKITAPFEEFVEEYIKVTGIKGIRAVFSGIPIPSVATYHFEAIDRLLEKHGLAKDDPDKLIERSIKREILKGLAQDFGNIKEKYADEVLIAHTTSVGGMYQIINDEAVIKTGYAHSSLGDLLKEKQFYANELTIHYSNFGLKSLVTAAAIGIDYIYQKSTLPLSSGVSRKYRMASEGSNLPFDLKLVKDANSDKLINKVFPSQRLSASHPIVDDAGIPVPKTDYDFGNDEEEVKTLNVSYALRSGENGLFSLDNAYALYLNMKIASQEELAHVLVYNAFFGDDEQKPWFDEHGICYYTQTDNSSLIFALLNNRREFRNYQTSAFTPKAFQELGSSKHQAELHTSALFILLHKLKNINPAQVSKTITSKYNITEVMEFVDKNTPTLLIEDIVNYGKDNAKLGADFAELFELKTADDIAGFVGFKGELHGFIRTFFDHLLTIVNDTINAITSLGTPIIYTNSKGKDVILSGPYFAPLDLIIKDNFTLLEYILEESVNYKMNQNDFLEWVICNNGLADMRPKAVFNTAKIYQQGLVDAIRVCDNIEDFRKLVNTLKQKNGHNLRENYHYSTSGLVAYTGRILGLYEQISNFDLSLGTLNGWKALFPVDSNNNHPLIPGLVEAMRMYSEGLGKITGSEFLYPKYGYFD